MNLRRVKPSEQEALLGWIREYFTYDGIAFDEKLINAGLGLMLRDPHVGWAWFIEVPVENSAMPEIVGYAIATPGFDLEFGGRRATLTDLYLSPSHRRRGLGSVVLAAIEGECRREGCLAIELQVESDNREAQGLYRKSGFVPHDRIPMSKRWV